MPKRTSKFSLRFFPLVVMNALLGAANRLGAGKPLRKFLARRINSPRRKRKAFANYTPTQHDVFVCAYSKSGTNWALQLVTQIAYLGEGEFDHIHDLVPWPEAPPYPAIAKLTDHTYERSPTEQRAIKTHAESEYVPFSVAAKYLVIIRDPKDVVVSAYHFMGKVMPGLAEIPFNDWLDFFIGENPGGSWAAHTAGFWSWKDRKNVLVVQFSEMKNDLEVVVTRIAELMGVQLNPEQLSAVVERGSFDYMRERDEKFAPPFPTVKRVEGEGVMLRSGKVGSGRDVLTVAQQIALDEEMVKQLQRAGSNFPYRKSFVRIHD